MTSKHRTAHARIRSAPETDALGLAGQVGVIVGETRPSASGEPVVGDAPEDYALAVLLPVTGATYWLRPGLLEPVHPDGTSFAPPPPPAPWRERPRGAPHRRETPVTRFVAWLEQFLPRLG